MSSMTSCQPAVNDDGLRTWPYRVAARDLETQRRAEWPFRLPRDTRAEVDIRPVIRPTARGFPPSPVWSPRPRLATGCLALSHAFTCAIVAACVSVVRSVPTSASEWPALGSSDVGGSCGSRPGQPPSTSAETVFWQSVMTSTNPEELEAYLLQFSNGVFRALARGAPRVAARDGEQSVDGGQSNAGWKQESLRAADGSRWPAAPAAAVPLVSG